MTDDRRAKYTDDAQLAELREKRFLERQARWHAIPGIDPRLVELLLDRELWDTQKIVKGFKISQQRLSMMRRFLREKGGPHPSAFLGKDFVKHRRYGVENDEVEVGRVREWLLQTGRYVFDHSTGELVRAPRQRHGRARSADDN